MSVKVHLYDPTQGAEHETHETEQVQVALMWESRGKWYTVSTVTITHNLEFPTPAINVVAPNPGIRFTVIDHDGNVLYTNQKVKEEKS